MKYARVPPETRLEKSMADTIDEASSLYRERLRVNPRLDVHRYFFQSISCTKVILVKEKPCRESLSLYF